MDLSNEVLKTIRKIIRAIDLHSKKLSQVHGLTSSQAVVLSEIQSSGPIPVSVLAQNVSLSAATVTDILHRLEKKAFVVRERDETDRRRILVCLTEKGANQLSKLPSMLQQRFLDQFEELQEWEKHMILSNLQRVAHLMDAERLDAAPLLASGTAINDDEP